MQTRLNNEIPRAQDAIKEDAASIPSNTTILGVTGTLAASDVTLDHLGGIAGDSTVLAGCNIGTVTLTDCFGVAVASAFDLSDNRLDATALEVLIQAMYDEIVTGTSSATVTLDISGNAVPNEATIGDIRDLVSAGCTITCDAPDSVTVSGGTPDMAGTYVWDQILAYWISGTNKLHWYAGTGRWRVEATGGEYWERSGSLTGTYIITGGGAVGMVLVAAI